MFDLVGFLRPEALAQAVADLAPRFDAKAFPHARNHDIYFRKDIAGLAPDHPALTLCANQIGDVMQRFYEWEPAARFLAAAMEMPTLYTMAAPSPA